MHAFLRHLPLTLSLTLLATSSAGATNTASGTMAVSVTVANSMNLYFTTDSSGIALTNTGTAAVTASFGTMSAYGGTVPTGVTRTVNSPTNWQIATPFDVNVYAGNVGSSSYTLTAQLQTLDATNTWALNGTTISSSSLTTLTTNGTYSTATAYTFSLTIPFSENATTISNTINFVATAN